MPYGLTSTAIISDMFNSNKGASMYQTIESPITKTPEVGDFIVWRGGSGYLKNNEVLQVLEAKGRYVKLAHKDDHFWYYEEVNFHYASTDEIKSYKASGKPLVGMPVETMATAFQWHKIGNSYLPNAYCVDGFGNIHLVIHCPSDPTVPLFTSLQHSHIEGWQFDGTAVSKKSRSQPLNDGYNLKAFLTSQERQRLEDLRREVCKRCLVEVEPLPR